MLLSTKSANLHSLLLEHAEQSPSFVTKGSSLSPIEKMAAMAPKTTSDMTTISRNCMLSPYSFISNPAVFRSSQKCGYDFVTTCGSLMRNPS